MRAITKDKWETLQEKAVMLAARNGDNSRVQAMLDLAGESMSDGMHVLV